MKIEEKIQNRALGLGFELFGITDTHVDEQELKFFDQWLEEGKGANMSGWLGRGRKKRGDLGEILEGVKSVIVVGWNYYQIVDRNLQIAEGRKRVARYAWGDDYHEVMGERLEKLCEFLGELGDADAKWYIDTGAILERYFAVKAGLGFIGKNTCLITPEFGSFVFIGVLLTRLELDCNLQLADGRCGDCRRCIDACPAGALSEKCVDARKCISYLTIEKKGEFTEEEAQMVAGQDFCFGCDVCQEVCPFNGVLNVECRMSNVECGISNLEYRDLPKTEEEFNKKFKKSPLRRAGLEGMRRNLKLCP